MKNIKYEQELTVELNINYDDVLKILNKNGYNLIEELTNIDIYMLDNKCTEINPLEQLKQCVIIRNIITKDENIKMLLYKYKEYNKYEEIIKEGKVSCLVSDISDAQNLMEALGYKRLIEIVDNIKIFSNSQTEFAIQLVNGKHVYLELENDGRYNNIEEMKKEIDNLGLPLKDKNYFVKKAQIEIIENY